MFFLLIVSVIASNPCTWTDENGYTYNLKPLDKEGGWQVKDETSGMGMFSMVYIFNFCDFTAIKCHEKSVGAIEALAVMGQVTENCDVAGLIESQKITHIDEKNQDLGILISYGLGDLCMDPKQQPNGVMQPRQAQFQIECGSDEKEFAVLPESECVDKFRIQHSSGCRGSGGIFFMNLGSHWFLNSLIILCLYFGGRFIYNRKVKGLEGEDAIPHGNLINQMTPRVLVTLRSLSEKIQTLYQRIRSGGYDRV